MGGAGGREGTRVLTADGGAGGQEGGALVLPLERAVLPHKLAEVPLAHERPAVRPLHLLLYLEPSAPREYPGLPREHSVYLVCAMCMRRELLEQRFDLEAGVPKGHTVSTSEDL
jgi:hypothetical protein